MRLKSIDRLHVGDQLAKPVYDEKCQLLLAKDAVLTDQYIKRLRHANIQCIYVEDELSSGIEFESVITDELKVRSINTVKTTFKSLVERKSTTYTIQDFKGIQDIIDEMLQSIYEHRNTLYCMTELMGTDMYTYHHCAEVAILSMLVASSMGMNQNFIHKIGVGAMLHDIGKMKIEAEILNKSEKLTPEELSILRTHPKLGYDMLKDSANISPISRQIVYLHHEKLNGSGYPLGIKAEDIPVHVRIVTICDIFNAITSNRSYMNRLNADMALEILRAETVYELDREIFHHLLKIVNIYPAGTVVELTDGRMAIVIKENREVQTRPMVQVIENDTRQVIIDLMEHLTLFISKTVDY